MQPITRESFIEDYVEQYMEANQSKLEQLDMDQAELLIESARLAAGSRYDYILKVQAENKRNRKSKSYTVEEMQNAYNQRIKGDL